MALDDVYNDDADDGHDDYDEIGHKYRVWHLVHTTRGWEVRFTPMINSYSELIIIVLIVLIVIAIIERYHRPHRHRHHHHHSFFIIIMVSVDGSMGGTRWSGRSVPLMYLATHPVFVIIILIVVIIVVIVVIVIAVIIINHCQHHQCHQIEVALQHTQKL